MNNIDEKLSTIPYGDIEMIAETWAQQLRAMRELVNQSSWSADAKQRWNEDILPNLAFGIAKVTSPDSEVSTRLYGLIENAVDHPTVNPAEIAHWANQQTSSDTTHQIMATVPIW